MDIREYYDRINTQLFKLIPQGLGRVLEVGCGAGALGQRYKAENPDTEYIGIELDEDAATLGRDRLDRVITANIEQADDRKLNFEPATFDAIIYGDVLEHLIDPWAVLDRHSRWLKPDGYVVASIPNVQNWTILRDLLRGRWDYQDEGLLDRTHLRFFTLESIHGLFAQAGLRVDTIATTQSHDPSEYAAIAPHLDAIAHWLAIDPNTFNYHLKSHQYVVVARRTPRRLLVQTMDLGPLNSERVRTREVGVWYNRVPGVRALSATGQAVLSLGHDDEEKVFIWQTPRLTPDLVKKQLPNLLTRGYLTVVDLDRDPDACLPLVESDYLMLRCCHAVQVATPGLAEAVQPYNPNVKVFANHLPELPIPRGDRDYETAHVLLVPRARSTWEPLLPALNGLLTELGDRASMTVVGDRDCFAAIDAPHKAFAPLQPHTTYQRLLRQCNIALLPLEATPRSALKSDLHFLEAAAAGLAVLVPPTVYSNTIQENKTGLVYRSPDEFAAKLRSLLTDAELRERIGRSAYRWVGEHRLIKQHILDRVRWYYQLRDRLPQLNAQLRDRLPELFPAN